MSKYQENLSSNDLFLELEAFSEGRSIAQHSAENARDGQPLHRLRGQYGYRVPELLPHIDLQPMELIAVVMRSPTVGQRFEDAKALLDYGFANYSLVPVYPEAPLGVYLDKLYNKGRGPSSKIVENL